MEIPDNVSNEKRIHLTNNREYYYTVQPFELLSLLGISVARLTEYSIYEKAGHTHKLYKTKEGNWYEMPDTERTGLATLLNELKMAIDTIEKGD